MKRRISRYISITVVLMICCIVAPTIVYATEIDSFLVDNSTRWAHYDGTPSIHMGSKGTTYHYSSSTVKSNYSSYVTSGIELWDLYISCIENSSSPMGTISVSAMDSGANADTLPMKQYGC